MCVCVCLFLYFPVILEDVDEFSVAELDPQEKHGKAAISFAVIALNGITSKSQDAEKVTLTFLG